MQLATDASGGHESCPCNEALQSELENETETDSPSSSVSCFDATNDNEQPESDAREADSAASDFRPVVVTWPGLCEMVLLAHLLYSSWSRRSGCFRRRTKIGFGVSAVVSIAFFVLASPTTAVAAGEVEDAGAGDVRSGVKVSPLNTRSSVRNGSAGSAVFPPRRADGTFDCSFRDAEAKELLFGACSIAKGATFVSGSPATVVAALAVGLTNEEVSQFEAAHSYCTDRIIRVVSPSDMTVEGITVIAIRIVARFEAGNRDCTAIEPGPSMLLDPGVGVSQRFDGIGEGWSTTDAMVHHIVALIPLESHDGSLAEIVKGDDAVARCVICVSEGWGSGGHKGVCIIFYVVLSGTTTLRQHPSQ